MRHTETSGMGGRRVWRAFIVDYRGSMLRAYQTACANISIFELAVQDIGAEAFQYTFHIHPTVGQLQIQPGVCHFGKFVSLLPCWDRKVQRRISVQVGNRSGCVGVLLDEH